MTLNPLIWTRRPRRSTDAVRGGLLLVGMLLASAARAAGGPIVTTLAADQLMPSGAVLNATVEGGPPGVIGYFRYGRSTEYGAETSRTNVATSGTMSAALSGLVPGVAYHFQAVAISEAGRFGGADMAFTTPTGPSAHLASLTLDAAPLLPRFAPEITAYVVEVPRALVTVAVTAAGIDAASVLSVRVNGGTFRPLSAGAPSTPLALAAGINQVEVKAVVGDGLTTMTYVITVARPPDYGVATLAGLAGNIGTAQGTSTGARFNTPTGLAVDGAGTLFVADQSNFTIRRVSPGGDVANLAGIPGTSGTNDGPAATARFLLPEGLAVDAEGTLYVADTGNHSIRKVALAGGAWTVSTLAGKPAVPGSQDGVGNLARFNQPSGIAFDLATRSLLVADRGNHTIRRVTQEGLVTTLAGEAGARGSSDGAGPAAHFSNPDGLTVDTSGNVIVADSGNQTIRRITPEGTVTTWAGTAGILGSTDAVGLDARFNTPQSVAVDPAGNILVADRLNQTIRRITPAGVVSTMAGFPGAGGVRDGVGSAARFNHPWGLAVDRAGAVYIADAWNHTVRVASPGILYAEDFESAIGPEWSATATSFTPTSGRRFLGEFGNQSATLTLSNLPPHTAVTVSCDVMVIRSWDGNSVGSVGPDAWVLEVVGGGTILSTTFSNTRFGLQAYPGARPGGEFYWQTGASEVGTLGYLFNNAASDAVYRVERAFAHTGGAVAIRFRGAGLQGLTDESWGLDNVRVAVTQAPGGLLDLGPTVLAVGEEATQAVVQVNRIGGSEGPMSVDWSTSDGTAWDGSDYAARTGTLLFADHEVTRSIVVPIVNDAVPEATETLAIRLTNPGTGAALARHSITLQIVDEDGRVELVTTNFLHSEKTYGFSLGVRWLGNTNATVSVPLVSVNDSASDGDDFLGVNTTVGFLPGETNKGVYIFLKDDITVEGDTTFFLRLNPPGPGAVLGAKSQATVLLLDDDAPGNPGRGLNSTVEAIAVQPDGRILVGGVFTAANGVGRTSVARFNADGAIDTTFVPATGSAYWGETVALQADGKILLGGSFTSVGGQTRNRIARLTAGGALDSTFAPPGGANNTVLRVLSLPGNKVLVVGSFTTMNGVTCNRIARLNSDGTLDPTFDTGAGASGTIYGAAVQSDGRVIISGAFTTFNNVARTRLARLNANGALDDTFVLGTGLNARANVVLALPDDKLLLGGLFATHSGVSANRVMRLNADGSPDLTFSVGIGPDNTVLSLSVQADGKILVGGDFSHWNGRNQGYIARLNPDGSVDPTFAIGWGANAHVTSVGSLPDGRVAVAGNFSVLNGFTRRSFAILSADGTLPDQSVTWVQWPTVAGGNDHYYALTARPESWPEAEAEAHALGAHLVTVNSAEEQSFVERTFLRGLDRLRPIWIGFTDSKSEGSFAWAGGEVSAYTHWGAGEPNNNGDEDFAAINWGYSYTKGDPPDSFGEWNDLPAQGSFGTMATGPLFAIMESVSNPSHPRITVQPAGLTVLQGDPADLRVQAAGPGTFTYQWHKDGRAIPDATNTAWQIAAATAADAGVYSVIVDNGAGHEISAEAILRVLVPPVLNPGQVTFEANRQVVLRLAVPAGVRVVVEISADLRMWTPLIDLVTTHSVLDVADPGAAASPSRFYRVKFARP